MSWLEAETRVGVCRLGGELCLFLFSAGIYIIRLTVVIGGAAVALCGKEVGES